MSPRYLEPTLERSYVRLRELARTHDVGHFQLMCSIKPKAEVQAPSPDRRSARCNTSCEKILKNVQLAPRHDRRFSQDGYLSINGRNGWGLPEYNKR